MTKQKTNSITFDQVDEFAKDMKSLKKHFRSVAEDLEAIEGVLKVRPEDTPPFSYRIDNLGIETCVIKVRKIACKSLKGRGVMSGLRLVYAYFEDEGRIVYIEMYHKNDKELEDRERIKKYFK